MRKKIAIMLAMSSFSAVACNYELYDDGPADDWEWDDDDDGGKGDKGRSLGERALQTCDAFCVGLVECGVVEDDSFLACRQACTTKYEENEDEVRSGCDCVAAAQCDKDAALTCEDDPLPGVWLGGGGNSGTGGSDGAGGSGDGDAGGSPPGVACVASCQCAEGEACEEGFCVAPMEPALMCVTACDCTSGESCQQGFCQ